MSASDEQGSASSPRKKPTARSQLSSTLQAHSSVRIGALEILDQRKNLLMLLTLIGRLDYLQ
jgi:hypothetical protein